MTSPRRSVSLASALAVAALVAGCGSDDEPVARGLDVLATTAIAADIAGQVGGDDVEVTQLIPDSVSPHDFQASAQDRQRIADADLLVEFGSGLEAKVPDDDAGTVFRFTDHAGDLREIEHEHEAEESDEDEGEHSDEELDPHIWTDPTRIATALPALAEALAEADPDSDVGFESRAQRYASRLVKLDQQIAELARTVPPQSRNLVTSHEALGYFADRYGFRVVATPFGLSPEAEASADDIRNVIAAVEAEDVPAVFVEQGDDPQVLERVADETGVKVVDDLLVEGFAPGLESYVEMVRFTAIRILEALGGKAGYVLEFE